MRYKNAYLMLAFALTSALWIGLSSSALAQQQTQVPPVILTDLESAALKADVWQFKVLPLGRANDADKEKVVAEGRIRLADQAIFFNDADDINEAEDDVRVGDYELHRRAGGTLEVRLIFKETLQLPEFIQGMAKVTYDADEPGRIWNGSFAPKGSDKDTKLTKENYKFELRRTVD